MAQIPSIINGVTIEFSSSVSNEITSEMLSALNSAITSPVDGQTINKLWISSAKDSHSCPSRHVTGNAIDISRINGLRIGEHYNSNSTVKKIVDGLQTRFENAPKRRENFGPTIKKKNGQDHNVSGHQDHFHWSVNGDHSGCTFAFFDKLRSWWRGTLGIGTDVNEICDK